MTIIQRIHSIALSSSTSSSSSDYRNNKSSFSSSSSSPSSASSSTKLSSPRECRLLATSVSRRTQNRILAAKEIDGPLCKYRKGFFDHLKPKPFVMSTLRVVTQQGTLILANFMTDQMEQEMKRHELFLQGKISPAEAKEQSEEWEKREWEKRWQVFPSRLFTAFAKFHVITLVMRCYESIAASMYDKVTLDKLTMDPFQAARKISSKQGGDFNNNKSSNKEVAQQMFHTTFWANLIAFMADYSVHQIILCYFYVMYIRDRRNRRNSGNEEEKEGEDGALFTSFLKKSTQLALSRSFGLVCSAAGGAVGTLILPGWGTLLASNMGEGFAGVILEDGQGK